jgi:FlaG/FlaF family flagellin (archaellin)
MAPRGGAGERGTAPITGVVMLLTITLLVAVAVGTGVFLNQDTVNAGVQVAVSDREATILWTEEGSATHILVTTERATTNATIQAVNGSVKIPDDVGAARRQTTIIVRAVNNESSRIIEERTVDLS